MSIGELQHHGASRCPGRLPSLLGISTGLVHKTRSHIRYCRSQKTPTANHILGNHILVEFTIPYIVTEIFGFLLFFIYFRVTTRELQTCCYKKTLGNTGALALTRVSMHLHGKQLAVNPSLWILLFQRDILMDYNFISQIVFVLSLMPPNFKYRYL